MAKDKYILTHSVITSADPETIWHLWSDVENWKQFDTLVEYSHLEKDAEFTNDTKGVVKAQGAPKTKFKLLAVVDGISFTERLYVPLFQTIDLKRHVGINQNGKTVFTHEVHFRGRLRYFVHLAAARTFEKELPLVMGRLKAVAEAIELEE